MIRAWLGIALFAVFWLVGLQYYHQTDWLALNLTEALRPTVGLDVSVQTATVFVCGLLILLGTLLLLPPGDRESVGASERERARTEDTDSESSRSHVPTLSRSHAIALLLLLPPLWVMPWPYRVAPLLLVLGLLLLVLPIPRPRARRFGSALAVAGIILLGQALAMVAYVALTARSHELPWPLPDLVASIAGLLGADVAVGGSQIAVWSMRQVGFLGATWELLVDPPSLCFLVGGAILLALRAYREPAKAAFARPLGVLVLCLLAWLPIRAGLLIALYLHRLLRTDYDAYLELMNQFWSPWLLLLLLVPPVLLAWRFVGRPLPAQPPEPGPPPNTEHRTPIAAWASAALAGLALAAITTGLLWDPIGVRKGGRLLLDEHHSTWEPTEKPYDTAWYGHDSGYNYACIYDYLSRFYDIGRQAATIDDDALAQCDVLIVKVPTTRYTQDEIAAILRFVERGGGLLLIGEHTDVFHTGTGLNDIARHFGFSFRFDCLFGVDTIFDDLYLLRLVPHPIVQNLPPNEPGAPSFDFAVSCSIAPGASSGRAVMLDWGLKELGCDYHATNYYPQVEDRADIRYGAFVQLWATRAGAGRVVAHADSTQFSNFCTFEPGKAELLLGMIEWLNHRNTFNSTRLVLVLLGLVLLAGALFLARAADGTEEEPGPTSGSSLPADCLLPAASCRLPSVLLLLLAAGLFGWSAAALGVRAAQRAAMPLPEAIRPLTRVVIDRTLCDGPLSKSGFIGGKPEGFGIFERWILRLGYFTSRRADTGQDTAAASSPWRWADRLSQFMSGRRDTNLFDGDLIVFMHPHLDVSQAFVDHLTRYVEDGGKVLVLDSPDNVKSTANSLLYPFDLKVVHESRRAGQLAPPPGWPAIPVTAASEVTGGTPLCRVGTMPVAATTRYGKGTVTVLGFGSRFNDTSMGVTGDAVPDPAMQKVYDFEFALLRAIVEGTVP